MAKAKKTKKEIEPIESLEPMGTIQLREPVKLEECEWCFQFDDEEPQIFAWTGENDSLDEEPKVIFTVTNTEDSYITFTHKSGKSFKLFARQLTDEGRKMREYQTKLNTELENESENKEA